MANNKSKLLMLGIKEQEINDSKLSEVMLSIVVVRIKKILEAVESCVDSFIALKAITKDGDTLKKELYSLTSISSSFNAATLVKIATRNRKFFSQAVISLTDVCKNTFSIPAVWQFIRVARFLKCVQTVRPAYTLDVSQGQYITTLGKRGFKRLVANLKIILPKQPNLILDKEQLIAITNAHLNKSRSKSYSNILKLESFDVCGTVQRSAFLFPRAFLLAQRLRVFNDLLNKEKIPNPCWLTHSGLEFLVTLEDEEFSRAIIVLKIIRQTLPQFFPDIKQFGFMAGLIGADEMDLSFQENCLHAGFIAFISMDFDAINTLLADAEKAPLIRGDVFFYMAKIAIRTQRVAFLIEVLIQLTKQDENFLTRRYTRAKKSLLDLAAENNNLTLLDFFKKNHPEVFAGQESLYEIDETFSFVHTAVHAGALKTLKWATENQFHFLFHIKSDVFKVAAKSSQGHKVLPYLLQHFQPSNAAKAIRYAVFRGHQQSLDIFQRSKYVQNPARLSARTDFVLEREEIKGISESLHRSPYITDLDLTYITNNFDFCPVINRNKELCQLLYSMKVLFQSDLPSSFLYSVFLQSLHLILDTYCDEAKIVTKKMRVTPQFLEDNAAALFKYAVTAVGPRLFSRLNWRTTCLRLLHLEQQAITKRSEAFFANKLDCQIMTQHCLVLESFLTSKKGNSLQTRESVMGWLLGLKQNNNQGFYKRVLTPRITKILGYLNIDLETVFPEMLQVQGKAVATATN